MSCRFSCARVLALLLAGLLGFAPAAVAQQQPGPPPPPTGPAGRRPPPPPPPPLDRAGVADQINRIHRALAQGTQKGEAEREMFSEANIYLQGAQEHLVQNQVFAASRFAGAADALARALDRLQHRDDAPGPPPLAGQDLRGHLIEVYFRVRQADYFLQESHDASAKPLVELSRRFYELARQAFDGNHMGQAEDYAQAAEDIVQTLEFLAQSAVGASGPPPLR